MLDIYSLVKQRIMIKMKIGKLFAFRRNESLHNIIQHKMQFANAVYPAMIVLQQQMRQIFVCAKDKVVTYFSILLLEGCHMFAIRETTVCYIRG